MFDLKTIATSAITAIVVVVVAGLVGGNQSDQFGATGTRFPNGISTDSTSPVAGEVRTTTFTASGNLSAAGATTKLGSNTSVNTIYFGAADGCMALRGNSSTTLTASATSTSFCN